MPRQFGMVFSECIMRGHITYFANSALITTPLVSLDWCTYWELDCVVAYGVARKAHAPGGSSRDARGLPW